MVRDEFIADAVMHLENGKKWLLQYYLRTYEKGLGKTLYGIRVDKCRTDGQLTETEATYPITESRVEAMVVLKAFCAGSVPPCTLLEMIDELDFPSGVQIAG